jgi:hypothetical protein
MAVAEGNWRVLQHVTRPTAEAAAGVFHNLFSCEKSPPGNCGKADQTTVAAFLPWRGLSVLNPQLLTEPNHPRKIDIVQSAFALQR